MPLVTFPTRTSERLALLILASGLLAGLYAWSLEPYWIDLRRLTFDTPLSKPLKVAFLTDLHTYGLGRREAKMLSILDAELPDAILIGGDSVIDGDLAGPPLGLAEDPSYARAAEVLRRLRAPLGVWTVRGNWEVARHVPNERAFYETNGVRFLSNEAAELRSGVWVAGLDDGSPDASIASRHIPPGAFVIALFHSPATFDAVAGRWPLALAGHTHGGQVRLPFLPPLWLPEGSGRYVAGWYESSGSRLYVSRGIGTAMLPIRFLCRPELVSMTIGASHPVAEEPKTPQEGFNQVLRMRRAGTATVESEMYAEGYALGSYGVVSAAFAAGFFPIWEAWKGFSRIPYGPFPGLVALVNRMLEAVTGTDSRLDPTTSPLVTDASGPTSLRNVLAGERGVWDACTPGQRVGVAVLSLVPWLACRFAWRLSGSLRDSHTLNPRA
jgi:hypothetical protein